MDKKKFDIEAVGASLDRKIRLATSEGKRSLETTKVLRYYNRELPKPIHPRQASYITTDVYDGVEGMKAQLLDIFCTGRELGSFTPQNSKDVEACRIATAYTNYVIFRQNDGFNIFQTIFDDALKARNGFVKVYWSEDKEYTEETFDGIPAEAAEALASMPEVDELEADIDPETGLASGRLTRLKRDRSQVRIEPIAPEDFGIEPQAKRLEGAFHYHRTWMTKAEIKSAGYDVKKLMDAQPNGSTTSITDITTYTRTEQTDDGYLGRNNGEYKDDMVFEVFECYDYITDKSGKRSLYKIVRCANETLHIEEIDRSPILSCALLPDGHNFWGKNFASMLIPAQNARTTLSRAVLDHAAISTNPRYLVVKGGLPKPSELLNNQLGGAINVASPDSVVPLAQPALNQFLFPTMEMIKANSEQTTGLTALSQGLNKDVISNQNSQGMINDQVDLAMTRQKVLARNFAYGFLTKLFIEVYRLVLENDKQQNIIEVAGQWAEINPQTWIERKDFEVTLHLTGSDAMMEASKYMTLLTQASQDPALNNMVTAKNRFNLAVKVMTYSGIKNVGDFITPPEQIPPSKPDPMAVAQLQIAQQQAQAGSMAAQATLLKAQTDAQHKQHQEMISETQVQLNTLKAQADSIRKNIETMSRIDLAQREQSLNEDIAARSPPEAGTVRGIISPGI